jgi:hypothetical protein
MNNDNKRTIVLTVNNVLEARDRIMKLRSDGYPNNGKIVILAWSGTIYYEDKHDDSIQYMTPYDSLPLL